MGKLPGSFGRENYGPKPGSFGPVPRPGNMIRFGPKCSGCFFLVGVDFCWVDVGEENPRKTNMTLENPG